MTFRKPQRKCWTNLNVHWAKSPMHYDTAEKQTINHLPGGLQGSCMSNKTIKRLPSPHKWWPWHVMKLLYLLCFAWWRSLQIWSLSVPLLCGQRLVRVAATDSEDRCLIAVLDGLGSKVPYHFSNFNGIWFFSVSLVIFFEADALSLKKANEGRKYEYCNHCHPIFLTNATGSKKNVGL